LEKALIIFARNPVLGKVKTRLASTIGNERALHIYESLLLHTADVTRQVDCNRYVFYADGVSEKDVWDISLFSKLNQEGDDLGTRMKNAFDYLFKQGYKKVLIIGSDCFELNASIIEEAFDSLNRCEAVIGPSADGGYYLLGMNKFYPFLFINKSWSTDMVYENTVNDFLQHQVSYTALPVLHDIDTEEDWNQYKINKQLND